MDPTRHSGIGRIVDPRYPSNLFVLVAAAASGLSWAIWKLVSEGDWGAALGRAAVAGLATFLAWAIARELDPDRPWIAGVAAVAAAALIGAGVPSLLIAGVVLMAVRVTARTTGRNPTVVDLAVVGGLALLAGASDTGLPAAVVMGVVLMVDRFLPNGAHRLSMPIGLGVIAASVAAAALWGTLGAATGAPHGPEWTVVPVAVIGLAALGRPGRITAVGDLTGERLALARVRLDRAVAVAAAAATFVWLGGPGLTAGSVVWVALAAAALPGRASND
ncbi:MAG: hypothetical protein MUP76_07205 [Acidimicrobiia bacterium]|nr:hypothetical protein [Acidimicrobiia bacterium]